MDAEIVDELPSYKKLVNCRAKMIWSLSVFLVLILFGNLFLMSVGSDIGNATLREDGVITVLVAYSAFVISTGALSAAFYVWWANTKLDPLIRDVLHDIETGG